MVNMSCEYTHDISNPRFADIDGDSWECPHQSVSGSARCVFHSEPGGPADIEPAEQICDLVANSRGAVRLLGAKFGLCSFARRERRDYVIAVESEEAECCGIGIPHLHSFYRR